MPRSLRKPSAPRPDVCLDCKSQDNNPLHNHIPRTKELLILAAKARIYRMMLKKNKRKDLEAPANVKQEWDKGAANKNDLAEVLIHTNFNKDPTYPLAYYPPRPQA